MDKIFCRNCKKVLPGNAVACTGCGLRPMTGNKYCYCCGNETHPEAVICIKCGMGFSGRNHPSGSLFQFNNGDNLNEAGRQPAFWAAVIIVVAFFMPWLDFSFITVSGWNLRDFVRFIRMFNEDFEPNKFINLMYFLPVLSILLIVSYFSKVEYLSKRVKTWKVLIGIYPWIFLFSILLAGAKHPMDWLSYGLYLTLAAASYLLYDALVLSNKTGGTLSSPGPVVGLKRMATIEDQRIQAAKIEYGKGLKYIKEKQYEDAIEAINTAIKLDSKEEYIQALGQATELIRSDKYKKAEKFFNDKNFRDASEAIEIALKYDPENADYISLKKAIDEKFNLWQRKTILYATTGGIVLLAAMVCILRIWGSRSEEKLVWDNSVSTGAEAAYNEYLAKYPDGRFRSDARDSISAIEGRDAQDWDNAVRSASVISLQSYVDNHPQGKFYQNAQSKIDSLYWDICNKEDNEYAYNQYIEKVPNGKHIAEAGNKRNEIQNEKVSDLEKDSVKAIIVSFYNYMYNQDYESLATCFPPIVDRYMELKNIGKASLIEVIRNWVDKNKITNQRNVIDWNSFQVTRTAESQMVVKFNVDIYYTAAYPVIDHNYNSNVTMILNPVMKVTSLSQVNLSQSSMPSNQ